jgi:hypothetical protein
MKYAFLYHLNAYTYGDPDWFPDMDPELRAMFNRVTKGALSGKAGEPNTNNFSGCATSLRKKASPSHCQQAINLARTAPLVGALYHSRRSARAPANVRLWHLAEVDADDEHVCFWGSNGHP